MVFVVPSIVVAERASPIAVFNSALSTQHAALTMLPQFLNLWTALLAAAIAMPALLILYFLKLRRREMPVASTFLWKKAIQDLQVNCAISATPTKPSAAASTLLLLSLLLSLARPVTQLSAAGGGSRRSF